MPPSSHLKSLQALEIALRRGSLKAAAEDLSITPAAVGQRIRSLEDYLGMDLLVRGRSGLHPTVEMEQAVADLRTGFAAIERVSEILNFQRATEIHVVAERDFYEMWLMPRLPRFQAMHPSILFSINGAGDVPMRLGAPDVRVEYADGPTGEELFTDFHVPLCSPDNIRRIADYDTVNEMEGMPLLHVEPRAGRPPRPDWEDWFSKFGLRSSGAERGPKYRHTSTALEAAQQDVGFLIAGLALVRTDIDEGRLVLPYSVEKGLRAPCAYRMYIRDGAASRPQIARFISWLQAEALETEGWLAAQAAS